jgi:hypothetical protein
MKQLATAFCLLFCTVRLDAGSCRLLLIPTSPVIKPGDDASFDLYVINEGAKAATIQDLKSWSAQCDIRSTLNGTSGPGKIFAEWIDHPAPKHLLMPFASERRRITMEVRAKSGDLAKIYVTSGSNPKLRSNTVLLYCPSTK